MVHKIRNDQSVSKVNVRLVFDNAWYHVWHVTPVAAGTLTDVVVGHP